jgi:thiamine biosynthesis lipoprotein
MLRLIVSLVLCLPPLRAGVAGDYFFSHDNVLGTSLELSVRADDAPAARRAEDRALREIDRLAAIFSNHDPSSEFRRWQAGAVGPRKVSPELIEVLAASDAWRERSGGAFDPRVQVFSNLWKASAGHDQVPTRAERLSAMDRLAGPAWRLDPSAGVAERLSDVPLTLDAIAKGYIVERACAAAMASDPAVRGLTLNVGGDLRVQGEIEQRIAIAGPRLGSETTKPLAWVAVKDHAIATSGRKHRGYQVQGRWYSHIIDPKTGDPAEGVLAASVIAERSADADALATILNVLPPDAGLRLADSLPGVACLIAAADGRVLRNAAWLAFERPDPEKPAPAPPQAQGGWGDEHELLVRFEINRPQAQGRYRRPYVAVWVEDEDGKPVRNLLLWVSSGGAGPFQWLPDLKRWHSDVLARVKVTKYDPFVISQPTRPPGAYSVLWDGKDDKGKPVKPGEYTVLIEAVREHGGYGLIRKRVTLANDAFVKELPGNDEIKSAKLEYRTRGTER